MAVEAARRVWLGKMRWGSRLRECRRSLWCSVMALRGYQASTIQKADCDCRNPIA